MLRETARGREEAGPPFPRRAASAVWRLVVLLGLVSVLLHALHLRHFLDECARRGQPLYRTTDTGGYEQTARAIVGKDAPKQMYKERILYSIFMVLFEKAGMGSTGVLWLTVGTGFPAFLSVAYLAGLLGQRRRSVVLAACALYLVYPNTYQYGAEIMTDLLHSHLTLMAVACTAGWALEDRRALGALAVCLWPLVMLTRPTFFYVAVFLLLLLCRPLRRKQYAWSGLLVAATLVVPLAFAAQNYVRHGLLTPSLLTPELLYRCILPQMKAVMAVEQGHANYSEVYNRERNQAPFDNPAWVDVFELKGPATNFTASYRAVMKESRDFIRAHPRHLWRSIAEEAYRQLLVYPLKYFPDNLPGKDPLPVLRILRAGQRMGMWMALFGLALAVKRGYGPLVGFVLGLVGLVFSSSVLVWWFGDRLRLPADVLLIPFVALAVCDRGAWLTFLAVLLAAYLPFRFLGLPEGYLFGMAGILSSLGLLAVLAGEDRLAALARRWRRRSTRAFSVNPGSPEG